MLNLFDSSVRKYRSIRAMGVPLMTGVGKTMPRELILQAAKDLRMLGKDGKTVIVDSEDEVEPGRGLRLRDIFDRKELLLIDLSLAETAASGGLLATRFVRFEDINFTSGIGMPFPASDRRRLTENFISLFEKKKGSMTWEQVMRRYASYFFVEYKKGDQEIEFLPSWKR